MKSVRAITNAFVEKLPCCEGKTVAVEIDGVFDEMAQDSEHDERCVYVNWLGIKRV